MSDKLRDEFLRTSDNLVNTSLSLTVATPARVTEAAEKVELAVRKYRKALEAFMLEDIKNIKCSVCGGKGAHICGTGLIDGEQVRWPIYPSSEDEKELPPIDSDDK